MERRTRGISTAVGGIVALVVIVILLSFGGQFFYVMKRVDAQEVGVQFSGGQVKDVVGPGVYSDFGLYVSLTKISIQAIPFTVTDSEIITRDKQRMGVTVSGDIFRLRNSGEELEDPLDILEKKWALYRNVFTSDQIAVSKVEGFAKQAMKVCVGDRTFDENTIGTTRDDLRICIDDQLDERAKEMGLIVRNVVVPDIILSPEVQAGLDAIVQSRLETEKAAQDELKAKAQTSAEQARVEGEIRVEQSRLQETTRQQITLAELERQRIEAQLVVIESTRANTLADLETQRQALQAQKANEILAAERDLDIRKLEADALEEKARGDSAFEMALAALFKAYPEYQTIVIARANASALTATDKIIFTVEGSTPSIVMPGPGIVPVVDTTPAPEVPE